MEYWRCRYKERWFDVHFEKGVCSKCRSKDLTPAKVHFFSGAILMDFGEIPDGLPRLSETKEMLIANIHVAINTATTSAIPKFIYTLTNVLTNTFIITSQGLVQYVMNKQRLINLISAQPNWPHEM